MEEIWKDIPGYEGLYQISNKYRVKSLSVKVRCNNGFRVKKERVLKINNGNYLSIGLSKNNVCKTVFIHKIIATMNIPNPDNKTQVNHKNGNKKDNSVENLEWVTPAENTQHALRTGLLNVYCGSNSHLSKLTEEQVIEIRSLSGLKRTELAKRYNVTKQAIIAIIKRKSWNNI